MASAAVTKSSSFPHSRSSFSAPSATTIQHSPSPSQDIQPLSMAGSQQSSHHSLSQPSQQQSQHQHQATSSQPHQYQQHVPTTATLPSQTPVSGASTVLPTSNHTSNEYAKYQSQTTLHSSTAGMPLSSSQGGLAHAAAAGAYRQSHSQPHSHSLYTPATPLQDTGIYLAVYSGIEVYEMEVNGVAVMRRKKDGWLNATQILKVAGVDKGKRTKILEKEIQTGEHGKVQGGYGKYQGTWISYDRGVEVCRQYGVEDVLRELLTYNMGDNMDPNRSTPTKEQAMAAQRKRMYSAQAIDRAAQHQSGTFFRNISSTASHAISAIHKARRDSPGPRSQSFSQSFSQSQSRPQSSLSHAPSFNRPSSVDHPDASQQSDLDSVTFSRPSSQQAPAENSVEPPRKKQRILTPASSFLGSSAATIDPNASVDYPPASPTEPNESFVYTQAGFLAPDSQQNALQAQPRHHNPRQPLPPIPMDVSPEGQARRSTFMNLFMESGNNLSDLNRYVQILRNMTPDELDSPLDSSCHTSVHWAATLSRTSLLQALVTCGASPFRANSMGETALMRAVLVTNSMELSSFPNLLDVLGATIEVRDNKGRTVLHHIAVASAVKGRNAASKYYLESLLEWVVRQGSSGSTSTAPSSSQAGLASSQRPRMGIRWFMDEMVNAQDSSGDTALNIAARIGNRSIISQLLEVGADCNIANRAGLRPADFGVGSEASADGLVVTVAGKPGTQIREGKSRENSDEIISSISNLLNETSNDFQTELRSKQHNVDHLTAQIRALTTSAAEIKKTLEARQKQLRYQQLARQRVVNYSRANEEEKFRLADLERAHPRIDASIVDKWKKGGSALAVGEGDESLLGQEQQQQPTLLPTVPAHILHSRIKAVKARTDAMMRLTAGLQGRSRDVELKYRKVVSLCTGAPESDIESFIDCLLRAVESEKGELDLGRVRRFLGGVDSAS